MSDNSIKGVEIFKTGTHGGEYFSAYILDEIARAEKEVDYKIPLTLGHTRDPSAPRYGEVVNVRRQGDTLLADLQNVDPEIMEAIRKKRYDGVSAELFFNLNRGDKCYPRALRALALLGAQIPGVAGLKPLSKMNFAAAGDCERVVTVSIGSDHPTDAGVEVDAAVRQHMQRTGERSYSAALTAVRESHAALYASYAEGPQRIPSLAEESVHPRAEAMMEIDRLVRARLNADPTRTYDQTLWEVLKTHPALAEKYRGLRDERLG